MQRNDRISEDVIKFFHNAKGSVSKNISKWTKNTSVELDNEHELQHQKWNNDDSPLTMRLVNMSSFPKNTRIPKKQKVPIPLSKTIRRNRR